MSKRSSTENRFRARRAGALAGWAGVLTMALATAVLWAGEPVPEGTKPFQEAGKKFEEVARSAERALKGKETEKFSDRTKQLGKDFKEYGTAHKTKFMVLSVLVLGIGVVSLLFGWAAIKTFFVPGCMAAGAVTGGALGALLAGKTGNVHISTPLLMAILACAGVLFYGFLGFKVKQIGVYLLAMTPCLIAGAMSVTLAQPAAALLIIVVGVLLAFTTMRRTRITMIVATSGIGTLCVLAGALMLWPLLGVESVDKAVTWLLNNSYCLLISAALIFGVGVNIQMTAGPPELVDEERKTRGKKRPLGDRR